MAHIDTFVTPTGDDDKPQAIEELPIVKATRKLMKQWIDIDAHLKWETGDKDMVVETLDVLNELVQVIEDAVASWQ